MVNGRVNTSLYPSLCACCTYFFQDKFLLNRITELFAAMQHARRPKCIPHKCPDSVFLGTHVGHLDQEFECSQHPEAPIMHHSKSYPWSRVTTMLTPEPTRWLQATPECPPDSSTKDTQTVDAAGARASAKWLRLCRVSPRTTARPLWSQPVLTASWPESRSLPRTSQQRPGLSDNRRAHKTHKGQACSSSWCEQGEAPLGLTGHLLFKGTLPRLGARADLPDTRKETENQPSGVRGGGGRGEVSNEKTGHETDK